ncbi:MAG TPA: DUF2029 domain-containing protein [Nitrospirae bacterium]|nr:DUF2029 domain-containing protein [Nitrospirota bacterium]
MITSEKTIGDKKKLYLSIALGIWITTIFAVAIMVYIDPTKRTVTNVYYGAVSNWFLQKEIYGDKNILFHYLPQFIYLYTPFYLLDRPLGDILWRVISLSLLVSGVYVFIREFYPKNKEYLFLVITLIIITPTIGALRNGQANLTFSGLCLWIMYFLLKEKWWALSFALTILIILKQTGLIITALIVSSHPHLCWRIILTISFVIIFPFLINNADYVLSQYKSALKEMSSLAISSERRFADISGLLRPFGISLQGPNSLILRAFAGFITLIGWLYASKRFDEPLRGILLFSLATAYLMLFHPMTEQNSYVIIAPFIALVSVYFWQEGLSKRIVYALMVICISIGSMPEIVRPIAPHMGLWFKPMMVILFYLLTTKLVISDKFNQKAL